MRVLLLLALLLPAAARAAEPAKKLGTEVAVVQPEGRFEFGSYGRVQIGSDLEGGTGRQVRLISRPPRLLEGPYAELDLGYTQETAGPRFHTHVTVALARNLFHYTGRFDDNPVAIRNLYLDVAELAPGVSVWGGSRMVRGDDIYLFDFWPLDEQNTVGAGASLRREGTRLSMHAGMNRVDHRYQKQSIPVPAEPLGEREILLLDRPRVVVTARGEQHFAEQAKAVLYGEFHGIGSGTLRTEDGDLERLPGDQGFLLGGEAGFYGFAPRSFVNLFARYARGLAAFDELGVPFGLDAEKKASGASEVMLGLSSNLETASLGLNVGGYARRFVDADPNVYDRDDVWELGLAARPAWFVTDHVHLVGEANLQYARPSGLAPESGRHDQPLAVQLAVMPTVSLGRGSYARPQLRLVYAATVLDDAARRTYAREEFLRTLRVHQFLGVGVEWWFNSSRY